MTKESSNSSTALFQENATSPKHGGLRTNGILKTSSKEKPLISIITVVFNGFPDIEKTILSVLNQTYNNIEYIIIDGNSTDGTLETIKKYENQIDYWISEKDFGIYDAMNKGAELCTGESINFLNCADEFYNINLTKLISALDLENTVIYGNIAKKQRKNQIKTIKPKTLISKSNKKIIEPNHQAMFFPKKHVKQKKYNTNYKISADLDYKIHAATNLQFIKLDIIFCIFDMTGLSNESTFKSNLILYNERRSIYQKYNIKHSKILLAIRYITRFLLKKIVTNPPKNLLDAIK